MRFIRTGIAATVVAIAGSAVAVQAAHHEKAPMSAIEKAVEANAHRSDAEKARDKYRHPAETLAFFGIHPYMTVAEPGPGGGWYTNILAPLLAENGEYIALNLNPRLNLEATPEQIEERLAWAETFVADKEKFGDNATAGFLLTGETFAEKNSVDAVLAFRTFHGWIYRDVAADALAEIHAALKPGGVFGIVQHRENEDSPNTPADRRGYLKESDVIRMVEDAGFTFVARSEINANPNDTKDWERGVWTLPPRLILGDQDREKYTAIGESDRMTLKFVKPAE